MRNRHRGQALLLGLLFASSFIRLAYAAQPATSDAVSTTNTLAEDDLEPSLAGVTVQAHRLKLGKLRVLINQAVDNFYDAFNKANTTPGYFTSCSNERRENSYVLTHVCHPKFVHDATQDDVQGFFYGYATVPAGSLIRLRMPAYRKRIRELIHTDPNVRQAALEFDALTQRYAAVNGEKVLKE